MNRLSFEEAYAQQITTSTLLLSMNAVSFETACEARFALERSCAQLSAARRTADHLAAMRAEIHRQAQPLMLVAEHLRVAVVRRGDRPLDSGNELVVG